LVGPSPLSVPSCLPPFSPTILSHTFFHTFYLSVPHSFALRPFLLFLRSARSQSAFLRKLRFVTRKLQLADKKLQVMKKKGHDEAPEGHGRSGGRVDRDNEHIEAAVGRASVSVGGLETAELLEVGEAEAIGEEGAEEDDAGMPGEGEMASNVKLLATITSELQKVRRKRERR